MSLNAIATPAAREPGPLVTRCRSRTVANALATANTDRARAAGLVTRPLDDTLLDTLAYENQRAEPRQAG